MQDDDCDSGYSHKVERACRIAEQMEYRIGSHFGLRRVPRIRLVKSERCWCRIGRPFRTKRAAFSAAAQMRERNHLSAAQERDRVGKPAPVFGVVMVRCPTWRKRRYGYQVVRKIKRTNWGPQAVGYRRER